MEGLETVSSAADLSASFTADTADTPSTGTAAPAADLSEPTSPDAEGAEGPEDLLSELNEPGAETAEEEQSADAEGEVEAEAEEPEAQAAAAEELPDGVQAVDRGGKKEYRLNEPRYQAFHGAYKTLREFSEIAGEPLTKEGFELRNNALIAENRLYDDMLSGDPDAQGRVIDFFFDQAKGAIEGGEVAGNPMVPFTQTFYERLRQHDADAYAGLRHMAAKHLVEEMYGEAAAQQSKALFLSVGHLAKTLGLPYKPETEMQEFFTKRGESDPVAKLREENESLKNQLNGRQKQTAEQQFATWRNGTDRAIGAALMDEAVTPALSSIAEQGYWKSHPDAFKDLVVNRLNSKVTETLKADRPFNERVAGLLAAARRAVSEQRRDEIRQQVKQQFVNRATLAVEAHKAQIIKDANDRVKEQSAATHERRKGAQNHRAPAGGGTPVKRSLVPTDMDFEVGNPGSLKASLDRLLA